MNQGDISRFDGMSLQQIEEYLRGLDHEELVALDANGKVIAAYVGDADSVAFPAVLRLVSGATVTHAHPVGAEGYGGTFSFADVLNMAASNWAEHRATASGSGEMNYIIRRTAKTTTQDSANLYNRIVNDEPTIRRAMIDAARQAGAQSPTARRQIYTGILDRYWSSVLPQYNFEYVKRKTPYDYRR